MDHCATIHQQHLIEHAALSSTFPVSSDDILRLLNASNGVDLSKIWKNGASVQLLVPSASNSSMLDSESRLSAGRMQPPSAPVIRRPPNAYQIFCNDWRPCLKELTKLQPEDYAFEANRLRLVAAFGDENVQVQLSAAPRDATLSTLLGIAWKSLSAERKEHYENQAEAIMTQFKRDHLNWRELLRSPMLVGPGVRKRKRTVDLPAPHVPRTLISMAAPANPTTTAPAASEDDSSASLSSSGSETLSDDDADYQEPAPRPLKRQRSNPAPVAESQLVKKSSAFFAIEPVAIAVTAATRTSIRESDWNHLFNTLAANQAIDQLTSGSA